LTEEQILEKYEVTQPPEERKAGVSPCTTCDAEKLCDAAEEAGDTGHRNPYFRLCHAGWNLKKKTITQGADKCQT